MAVSAFVVCVPEAEALVQGLRWRFDASAQLGVPAHISLLVPFMAPPLLTPPVLNQAAQIIAAHTAFAFSLDRVGRWPATLYLAPQPSAPFLDLTRALAAGFPDYPPYAGRHDSIVPHLTVADGNADEAAHAEDELRSRLAAHGPVHAPCSHVQLLENSSGRWHTMRVFALADAPRSQAAPH